MAGEVEIKEELKELIVSDVKLTGKSLGRGAYGTVEEVQISGAKIAAVKKLHPKLIELGSPEQVHKWVTDFVKECKLMSKLSHPHIVQFLGVCYFDTPYPALLMEKLQTSLDNLLETSLGIPLHKKASILLDICRGMDYLHSQIPPIVHRDLTAKNILVDSPDLTAKIGDLGVARMVNVRPGEVAATMTGNPGTCLYMAPETCEDDGSARYNTAVDVFSFGVISLFTLNQIFPKDLKPSTYFDKGPQKLCARSEVERRVTYIQKMKEVFGEAHRLVKMTLICLDSNPQQRPSAGEISKMLQAQQQDQQEHPEQVIVELPPQQQPEKKKSSWWKYAAVGGTAVVGGAAAVVAAPLVVGVLGFGAGGIAAGSIGASMMSAMGPVAAGGVVATLQSVGAAGLGAAGTAVVAATGATVAATAGTAVVVATGATAGGTAETGDNESATGTTVNSKAATPGDDEAATGTTVNSKAGTGDDEAATVATVDGTVGTGDVKAAAGATTGGAKMATATKKEDE